MSQADQHPGTSFAERLDRLFRTVCDPATRKPYSVRQVAAELTAHGYKISHTHLNNLRQGRAPDPRRSEMEAIAAFFGQPVTYFTAAADGAPHDLAYALADPAIKQVAMRLLDARLSPEGTAAVVAMIEQVRRLEAAARSRPGGRRPAQPRTP